MTPDTLKSYFVTLLIGSGDKIYKSEEEKLGIKFSISFLFFGINKVFGLESRVKLRENYLCVYDANSSFGGPWFEMFFSSG